MVKILRHITSVATKKAMKAMCPVQIFQFKKIKRPVKVCLAKRSSILLAM